MTITIFDINIHSEKHVFQDEYMNRKYGTKYLQAFSLSLPHMERNHPLNLCNPWLKNFSNSLILEKNICGFCILCVTLLKY